MAMCEMHEAGDETGEIVAMPQELCTKLRASAKFGYGYYGISWGRRISIRNTYLISHACYVCLDRNAERCVSESSQYRESIQLDAKRSQRVLCGPDILPHAFDPVPQIINITIPLLQTLPHAFDLSLLEHLWLYPVDPCDFVNLIDFPS